MTLAVLELSPAPCKGLTGASALVTPIFVSRCHCAIITQELPETHRGEAAGCSPGLVATAGCWGRVCEQSCGALSVLALRKPNNSRIIMEGGGVVAALQAMKAHPQEAGVQGPWMHQAGTHRGPLFSLALTLGHRPLAGLSLCPLRATLASSSPLRMHFPSAFPLVVGTTLGRFQAAPHTHPQQVHRVQMSTEQVPVYHHFLALELGKALALPPGAAKRKQACMLIRNLVSRSRAFSKPILDLGAEALITKAQSNHSSCEDVAKAALRDLGCHVEFQELWTGQRGHLAP
ncbi:hypothetical protein P7K49_033692 [Saguinus oedipus]|uniref:Uncharacterized protein n=1 Tax=Saguinus oedipus TaxID=9490 RepID=A0ABQ9TSM1_SAGOE|nr:hypothetical protein P7K49_033692 [Saguinus oedipus]